MKLCSFLLCSFYKSYRLLYDIKKSCVTARFFTRHGWYFQTHIYILIIRIYEKAFVIYKFGKFYVIDCAKNVCNFMSCLIMGPRGHTLKLIISIRFRNYLAIRKIHFIIIKLFTKI